MFLIIPDIVYYTYRLFREMKSIENILETTRNYSNSNISCLLMMKTL